MGSLFNAGLKGQWVDTKTLNVNKQILYWTQKFLICIPVEGKINRVC